MRFLHTADWHLGRTLCGQSFHAEQEWLLTGSFLDIVRETKPDAVLIAGDIYDRAVPPADAVELLDEILNRIIRGLGTPVVMIAGIRRRAVAPSCMTAITRRSRSAAACRPSASCSAAVSGTPGPVRM